MPYDASREALYHPETKPTFVELERMPRFEAVHAGFSLGNAWWLSNASHLAYSDAGELERELQRAGWRLAAFFSGESTQAFLATAESYAVLAFRGTETDNPADLKRDADVRLARFEQDARAHRGFVAALDEVWQAVGQKLKEVADRGLVTWFTGHSLGAGLATLAAARWRPDGLYTFGSPRVGDAGLGRLLDGVPVQRIVNCSDAATTVPGRLWGYRHVGELVFFTSTGKLLLDPSPSRVCFARTAGIASYWAGLPWLRRGVVAVRSFADHAIVNYTWAIARNVARV